MADPGTDAVVTLGIKGHDARADGFQQSNVVAGAGGGQILTFCWSQQPGRVTKQLSVGVFDPGVFFAGHGMSAKKTLGSSLAKYRSRPRQELSLGAATHGQQT